MNNIINALIQNSKSALFACIEIHNKPIFPYRYEVSVMLSINSWELLLKAVIMKFHPDVKVINEDGTTKPFEECLRYVNGQLGKDFTVIKENIEKLYEYRCNIIHFYNEDIDVILYSLLSKSIISYRDFLLTHFKIDIANETNLILLPIGFKIPASPIDFLSDSSRITNASKAVQAFVKSIVKSSEIIKDKGLDDSIFYIFKMSLINENRIKNADVIAAITKDDSKAAIAIENSRDIKDLSNYLKVNQVIHKVQEGLGNKVVFNQTIHNKCWKKYKVRPERKSANPNKTDSRFCFYIPGSTPYTYLYTQAWVNFLIEKLKDEDEFRSLRDVNVRTSVLINKKSKR
jgi:hypothetical protein